MSRLTSRFAFRLTDTESEEALPLMIAFLGLFAVALGLLVG